MNELDNAGMNAASVDVFALYQTLWRRAENDGAFVKYDGFMADGEGSFHHRPGANGEVNPAIYIGRPHYQDVDGPTRDRSAGAPGPAPDLRRELVTLAHEYGHFVSWSSRTPPDVYERYFEAATLRDDAWDAVPQTGTRDDYNSRLRKAVQDALTADQIELILREERLAWDIGRELLEGVGFRDFAYYENREREGIHFHRYRLGLDELRPSDL